MDERGRAVDLLQSARKHLEYGLIGALHYVYQLEKERELPWAETARYIAEKAIDHVLRARDSNAISVDAVQREGQLLLDQAISYVTRCECCEEPGKPISITDNLGNFGKVVVYLCERCEGLRRAADPTFMRWLAENLKSRAGEQKE